MFPDSVLKYSVIPTYKNSVLKGLLGVQELLTLPGHLSSPPVFGGVRVTRSLVLCLHSMFCRSLLVLLYFYFWPLCCLFFFDIRILFAPLVSSNSSYNAIGNVTSNFLGQLHLQVRVNFTFYHVWNFSSWYFWLWLHNRSLNIFF